MIRQYPIVTEERFMEVLAALTDNDTLFVQWRPETAAKAKMWPQVELLENFVNIHTNPNDSWWYIESGYARVWLQFPNTEERELPWKPLDTNVE